MKQVFKSVMVAAIAVVLAGCMWTGDSPYKASTNLTSSVAHAARSALLIESRNGSVNVAADADASEVSIDAKVRCGGSTQQEADDRLAATIIDVKRDAQGTLVIRPIFPEPKRSADSASFVIRLPEADGVTVNTSNGSVTVDGLAGALFIDTSNGQVSVSDHTGDAEIDTSNGAVHVSRHVGSLIIDTSNGAIELTDIAGTVTAETSNASIIAALRDDQPGPVRLDTSNGGIRLEVGPGFIGEVSLSTSNGSVTIDDAAGRVARSNLKRTGGTIHIGAGGERSVLDTSNANIKVTVRPDTTTAADD